MLKLSFQRAFFSILHLIVHSLMQHEKAAVICQPLFVMIEREAPLSLGELALQYLCHPHHLSVPSPYKAQFTSLKKYCLNTALVCLLSCAVQCLMWKAWHSPFSCVRSARGENLDISLHYHGFLRIERLGNVLNPFVLCLNV